MPLEINIPFPGFYESTLSQQLDHEVESWAEYFPEEERAAGIPPELRIGQPDFAWEFMDYTAAYDDLARDYLTTFDMVAHDALGFDLALKFSAMTSPRYYNFETDRLFATITKATARRLFAMSRKEKHATLSRILRERHTSRDGFISFYSPDLAAWLEKDVTDWDCNELASLLIACLEITGLSDGRDLSWRIANEMDDAFYKAFDAHMNWAGLDERIAEERATLEQELRETDPDYVPPVPRCPHTPDLFASVSHA